MQKVVLILTLLSTLPASAAPFILCDLPELKTFVSFDIGLQRFQLEQDGWLNAEVLFNGEIIAGEWSAQGRTIGITFKPYEDVAQFKWDSPDLKSPVYGKALCDFYERE
jgi:hypothetical protein